MSTALHGSRYSRVVECLFCNWLTYNLISVELVLYLRLALPIVIIRHKCAIRMRDYNRVIIDWCRYLCIWYYVLLRKTCVHVCHWPAKLVCRHSNPNILLSAGILSTGILLNIFLRLVYLRLLYWWSWNACVIAHRDTARYALLRLKLCLWQVLRELHLLEPLLWLFRTGISPRVRLHCSVDLRPVETIELRLC